MSWRQAVLRRCPGQVTLSQRPLAIVAVADKTPVTLPFAAFDFFVVGETSERAPNCLVLSAERSY